MEKEMLKLLNTGISSKFEALQPFTSANDVHVDWHLSLESSVHPHHHGDDQELYFVCTHQIIEQ